MEAQTDATMARGLRRVLRNYDHEDDNFSDKRLVSGHAFWNRNNIELGFVCQSRVHFAQ